MTHDVGQQPEYLNPAECRVADLAAVVSEKTELSDYPRATGVRDNVLVYDAARLAADLGTAGGRRAVSGELIRALRDGPGIVVFAGAFPDTSVVDAASTEFTAMIAEQHAAGGTAGDHFAAAGQNDRVWNALEKLARRAPSTFAAYYANDVIAAVSHAWLGPVTRSPRRSTWSTRAAPRRPRTGTTTWASSPPARPPPTRRTCTGCRRR